MAIVIVEDDTQLRESLEALLTTHGYEVIAISNYKEASDFLTRPQTIPELIILDRMLGSYDGADLCPMIEKISPRPYVLILSALNTALERSQIIDRGADDYLGKPYTQSELLSRIRALLRRGQPSGPSQLYKFKGNSRIDVLNHRVYVNEVPVDLSQKEYQLLHVMMMSPQKIFSKYELLERVWEAQADIESNVVEATIRNLRKKLEEVKSDLQIISKRNMGYWIEN
ncbi:MAG: response regulator transcription factor [Pseudobdellovibrionaceae bacterium]